MSTAVVDLVNCPATLSAEMRAALRSADLRPADRPGLAPEVIVAWLEPATAAREIAALREAARPHLPALVVVGVPPPSDYSAALRLDADLCLVGASPTAIVQHCVQLAASRRRFLQTSPLTGLPGNEAVARELARRFPQRGTLAVLAFDLDHFKGYNDYYGYERGDAVLRSLAALLTQAVAECARPGWLLGHLGGDDFVALVHPAEAHAVARRALRLFEAERSRHYDAVDAAAGGIQTWSRQGEPVWHPLLTLTIAQAGNDAPDITHAGQLAAILAELKQYGKSLPGSVYVPDRRRDHCSRRGQSPPGLGVGGGDHGNPEALSGGGKGMRPHGPADPVCG